MDLQTDTILEKMASSSSSNSAGAAAASASAPSTANKTGFPREIAQKNVEDKFLCGHCDRILRNPMQNDCGHRFCSGCRQQLLGLKKKVFCKACLKEGLPEEESQLNLESMFDDKAAIREMKKMPTQCMNQGCQWKGTFDQYITHETCCDKKMETCDLCGVQVSLARLGHHQTKVCPKREITCQYCKEKMMFEKQLKHQGLCPKFPVKCDKCSKMVPRNEMDRHKEVECAYRTIECVVPGCGAKLPFSEFPSHFVKNPMNTQTHMQYLFEKLREVERSLEQYETDTVGATAGASGGGTETQIQRSEEQSQRGENSTREGENLRGGRDVAGAEGGPASALGTEDKQKLKLHEDLMAVLHGEILRCIKQVEALSTNLHREIEAVKKDRTKMEVIQRQVGTVDGRLQEFEQKLRALEAKNPIPDRSVRGTLLDSGNGVFMWRLDNFSQLRRSSVIKESEVIVSEPFLSGPMGYRMRLRLFLDGEGPQKGKAISTFLQLMKGPYDDLLPWPFAGIVYFMLVDQQSFKEHKTYSFQLAQSSAPLKKPSVEPNPATGLPSMMSLAEFGASLDKLVVNDTLFFRVCIELDQKATDRIRSLSVKENIRR